MGLFSAVKNIFSSKKNEQNTNENDENKKELVNESLQNESRLDSDVDSSLIIQEETQEVIQEEISNLTESDSAPSENMVEEVKELINEEKTEEKDEEKPVNQPVKTSESPKTEILKDSSQKSLPKDANFEAVTLALRQSEPKLSAWLQIILEDIEEADELLWTRLSYLLKALETPEDEAKAFLDTFKNWLHEMDYIYLNDFRSELQYRLALALDLEDEEDERDRLFMKVQEGLEKTRTQFNKGLQSVFSSHETLGESFFEELEELFIMSDMGAELSLKLVAKLREEAKRHNIENAQDLLPYLQEEVAKLFKTPKTISAVNKPEVVLMIGVNGVGKTTTIAKLAYRAKMQGKRVLIAGADTFRAAAVEQLETWAKRIDADFYSKGSGADPAAVAYEAMDKAISGDYDIIFIDTAGRLHNKSNLMDELQKIRNVIGKKHEGAPHRSILVIDATTGQNALQQTKVFKESGGVNEIILTKLDGTAKGGVALSVANTFEVPITFIGLGEKMEDLRPFHSADFAKALFGDNALPRESSL